MTRAEKKLLHIIEQLGPEVDAFIATIGFYPGTIKKFDSVSHPGQHIVIADPKGVLLYNLEKNGFKVKRNFLFGNSYSQSDYEISKRLTEDDVSHLLVQGSRPDLQDEKGG